MKCVWFLLAASFVDGPVAATVKPPPCFSDVFCHGPLLHTVQTARIFNDSKTFVDMKMRAPPAETLAKFAEFMAGYGGDPDSAAVARFVGANFEAPGHEFLRWHPDDWRENPAFLDRIRDVDARNWAGHLNALWKDLGRQIKDDVLARPDLYSMIWVPNPVIVPGGRFREFYYWDSYWIVQGLLLSEMHTTAYGMLENFLYIVERYGHVPNGGRVYYLERSQPPLLTPMVKLYVDATGDVDFVAKHLAGLEREFSYWMRSRTKTFEVNGRNYTLAVYGENSGGPRPESYYEDITHARIFDEEADKEAFYSEIKAAAESGWDFSSRWFITNKTNQGNITSTKIRSIVPVDLNAIIYWNAQILSEFHQVLGNEIKGRYYASLARQWLEAVTAVLWHDDVGAWLDYDLQNSVRRDYFYPSNVAPLWTGCYPERGKEAMVAKVMCYLDAHNVSSFAGVPASFEQTGEQWDYPNVWPPLQHMLIVGLRRTEVSAAEELARDMAVSWIRTNYIVYEETKAMYEKYDAVHLRQGLGGEYEVQLGFGWTNGIVMYLLDQYGHEVSLKEECDNHADLLQNKYFLLGLICACLVLVLVVFVVLVVREYRRQERTCIRLDGGDGEVVVLMSSSSASIRKPIVNNVGRPLLSAPPYFYYR